ERVAHDGDAIEAALRQPRVPRVTFLEDDLKAFTLGTLARKADEIAGPVDTSDIPEAAPGQLQAMTALPAAQVEDRAVRVDRGGRHDEVDLAPGVLDVLDDVAVGLHVEGIEELAPPLLREMRLEIGDGAQARAGRRAPRPLHLRSYCHDG